MICIIKLSIAKRIEAQNSRKRELKGFKKTRAQNSSLKYHLAEKRYCN